MHAPRREMRCSAMIPSEHRLSEEGNERREVHLYCTSAMAQPSANALLKYHASYANTLAIYRATAYSRALAPLPPTSQFPALKPPFNSATPTPHAHTRAFALHFLHISAHAPLARGQISCPRRIMRFRVHSLAHLGHLCDLFQQCIRAASLR